MVEQHLRSAAGALFVGVDRLHEVNHLEEPGFGAGRVFDMPFADHWLGANLIARQRC